MSKDPVLSPLWPKSLLWHGFDPWLGNFHMLWAKKTPKRLKEEQSHEGINLRRKIIQQNSVSTHNKL